MRSPAGAAHDEPVTVRVLVVLAVLGVLAVLRPGVLVNAARSPVAWLTVAGVVLLAVGVRALLRRVGAPSRVVGLAGTSVVVVAVALLLAPSFQQRTLVESVPMAAEEQPSIPAPQPSTVVPVPLPDPTPAPSPEPRQLTGELGGIGHGARGAVSLRVVEGAAHLVFEGIDVEGTVGPSVHLVQAGARTPGGGLRVGELEAERGTFSYALPASFDVTQSWAVLIWCDPFDTPIAAADLS